MTSQCVPGLDYPVLCVDCVALVDAGEAIPAHPRLGRSRPEVGYALYRCTVCHAHWSRGPSGWAGEKN